MTTPRIALGCMGMSRMYGASSDEESIATIHAALERGVTFLDTGDFYGQGENERQADFRPLHHHLHLAPTVAYLIISIR